MSDSATLVERLNNVSFLQLESTINNLRREAAAHIAGLEAAITRLKGDPSKVHIDYEKRIDDKIYAAVLAEREACAKIAEAWGDGKSIAVQDIAAAIRARSAP